jgi:hypothetical protein
MLASASVALVGSIAWVGKKITQVVAVMAGGRVSHGRDFISKSSVMNIAKDQEASRAQLENQNNSIIAFRKRANELYTSGPIEKISNELRLWGIISGYNPGNAVGSLIHSNRLEDAYKEASKIAIKESGRPPRQVETNPDDMSSMYSMKGGYKNSVLTYDSFPMFPEAQAGLLKDGLITQKQIQRTNEIINKEIAKRQEYLDQALSIEEEKIAREFLGRQKTDEPPKFDFSGSTININQDFRNADPDRVFIKFAEDIGVVSANHIQSKLSPIVR